METEFQKVWKSDFSSQEFFKNLKKKVSEEAAQFISRVIASEVKAGTPQDQAVAIAHSRARARGFDVPEPPDKDKKAITEAVGEPIGDMTSERTHSETSSETSKKSYGVLEKAVKLLKYAAEHLVNFEKDWVTLPDGRHVFIGGEEALRIAQRGIAGQRGATVNLKSPGKVEIKVGDKTHSVTRGDVKQFFDAKGEPTSIGSFKGTHVQAFNIAEDADWAFGTFDEAVRMTTPEKKSIAKLGIAGAGPIPTSGLAAQALADYKPSKKWGREGKELIREAGVKYAQKFAELLKNCAKVLKDFGGHYDSYENGHYGGADSSTKETSNSTKETEKEIQKSFSFLIEKAFPVDEEGKRIEVTFKNFQKDAPEGEVNLNSMYLEGIATTANVDHDMEKMSGDAIDAMLKVINEKGVPLINEHQKTWDAKLGDVFKAWKDERNQLHIKAKLDKDNSRAIDLYKAIKKGLQVGLSVAGVVKRSAMEFVESLGKKIKTFYDVALKEISVTNRPSNFDTWLVAKNQAGSLEGHLFEKPHPFYEEYLQNYPSLNWQFEIAKSVAEVSKEVMPETETKEKVEEKSQFETFKSEIVGSMTKMAESFTLLAKEIEDLLKQGREGQKPTDEETSVAGERTTESTTETKADEEGKDDKKEDKKKEEGKTDAEETTEDDSKITKPCKTEAKKEEGTKEPEKKPEETTTETKTTEEDKKDEEEKSAEELKVSKRIAAELITEAVEKRMKERGMRVMGPLKETVEKMLNMPLGRKGIASEKAYMIEKQFAGNPYRQPPEGGGEKGDGDEEFQKDLKDEKMTFKDVFKKHFSSFKD